MRRADEFGIAQLVLVFVRGCLCDRSLALRGPLDDDSWRDHLHAQQHAAWFSTIDSSRLIYLWV